MPCVERVERCKSRALGVTACNNVTQVDGGNGEVTGGECVGEKVTVTKQEKCNGSYNLT